MNWGCGDVHPDDWINVEMVTLPGVDICSDIREGLPLREASIEYITSQHALQALRIEEMYYALRELRRVLEPDGVLRLCLPDFDKAIAAHQSGGTEHQWCWDWNSHSGNFIGRIIDCNENRTPLTADWTEELLRVSGFAEVLHVAYGQTSSHRREITVLDSRPDESFYIEGYR
jgi:ubiquinone/menaquinone biosynthesis C-methylase UbiE